MKSGKETSKKYFDDKSYWKKRHANTDNLQASGLKSVNLKTNHLIYKMLADQYLALLKGLDIDTVKTILDCGYGDGYFLDFFKDNFPDKSLSGIDISKDSKDKIGKKHNLKKLHVGDLTDFNLNKKFDLVHSFDVLYHILKESDYRDALMNIAAHSQKYVILHERFFKRIPVISASHVRIRRNEFTNQILNSQNFYLHSEIPSHFFAMRMFSAPVNKAAPKLLYNLDNYIANSLPDHAQEVLASHSIRVYKQA